MTAVRHPVGDGRPHAARRGSFMVASLLIVLALMMLSSGIYAVLQNQINASLSLKNQSLASLQAFYLAEMGVNTFMYQANQANSLPTGTFADLTQVVALTRSGALPASPPTNVITTPPASLPAQFACCWFSTLVAGVSYQCHSQLKLTTDSHLYERAVNFSVKQVNGQYVLASYSL